MKKKDMTEYLLNCLKEEKSKFDLITEEYEKAEHMERVGLCIKISKQQDMYYYLWGLCNDMGIIKPGDFLY